MLNIYIDFTYIYIYMIMYIYIYMQFNIVFIGHEPSQKCRMNSQGLLDLQE